MRQSLGAAFWRVWWANAVSSVGDGAFYAALPLLAVTITKDPWLISVVSAATYLPWLLLSLPAGVLIDRYERIGLMWRSQVVQGGVLAVIAILVVLRRSDIAALAVAGFCLSSAQVVFANAAQSVLPQLVPADLLARANGNQYVVQTVGQSFIGPPIGSALFVSAAVAPFGIDAGSFAGSAALLFGLSRQRAAPASDSPGQPGMLARAVQGVRWLAGHRLLRLVAVLLSVNNFAGQMGQATLVLLATQVLHVGSRGYGVLLIASAAGSVIGGVVNPALARLASPAALLVAASAANAAIYVGIGLAPDAYVAAALLACNGFMVTMWNVVTVTLRQNIVPNELLGRVNSAYRMLGWGMMPVGALAGGIVGGEFGLRAPFTVAGIVRGLALIALLPAFLGTYRAVMARGRPRSPGAGCAGPAPRAAAGPDPRR